LLLSGSRYHQATFDTYRGKFVNSDSAAAAGAGAFATVLYLIILVVAIVAMWKLFVKAGEPGWAGIIPFYNIYTLVKIAGLNPWLTLLIFVPVGNVVLLVWVMIKIGEAFGKSVGWSVIFLIILSFIGMLILGFGSATYHKPASGAISI
jgi:hypothetical protein